MAHEEAPILILRPRRATPAFSYRGRYPFKVEITSVQYLALAHNLTLGPPLSAATRDCVKTLVNDPGRPGSGVPVARSITGRPASGVGALDAASGESTRQRTLK